MLILPFLAGLFDAKITESICLSANHYNFEKLLTIAASITGMAAAVAGGAFQNGVYTYAKHFAFNKLEANRSNGMNCVMNEQTAREIYLRPFELAIKQGKLTGMMSSFMLMNAQWNGGNFNLMHGIVRAEWDFKGIINTDLAGSSIMGAERAFPHEQRREEL